MVASPAARSHADPNGGVAARGFAAGPNGYAAGFARVSPSDRYATAGYVRGNFNHWNYFGPGWYSDHPGAWFCRGLGGGPLLVALHLAGDSYGWFALPGRRIRSTTTTATRSSIRTTACTSTASTRARRKSTTTRPRRSPPTAPRPAAPSDGDWMPLGVFLLTKNGEKDSHDVFQLAINKQGIIRGNFQDSADDKTEAVQGSAEPQDAARRLHRRRQADSTVIETGLYNLTKDEAPVLIHFGADRTEQWLLVRLKNPGCDARRRGYGRRAGAAAPQAAPARRSGRRVLLMHRSALARLKDCQPWTNGLPNRMRESPVGKQRQHVDRSRH